MDNLQHFFLELGKGFAFVGRQYKISLAYKNSVVLSTYSLYVPEGIDKVIRSKSQFK